MFIFIVHPKRYSFHITGPDGSRCLRLLDFMIKTVYREQRGFDLLSTGQENDRVEGMDACHQSYVLGAFLMDACHQSYVLGAFFMDVCYQ